MRSSLLRLLVFPIVAFAAACGGDGGRPGDPCAGVVAECQSSADCPNGAACDACGRCADAPGCNGDDDCPLGKQCSEGVCVEAVCSGDDDCPDGSHCRDGACVPEDCNLAPCPDGLHCREADGSCVACTEDAHCTDPAAGFCETDAGRCVACRTDGDCGDGLRCSDDRRCVQCLSNEDCSDPTPICKVSSGICGECNTDDDCADGGVCLDDATCDFGPVHGEPCTADDTCAPGHLCLSTGLCAALCDIYAPECPDTTGCMLVGNEEGRAVFVDGEPLGVCVDASAGAARGAPCGGAAGACKPGLFCVPTSASGGTCRPFCEPGGQAETCDEGDSCLAIELGENGEEVGLCNQPDNRWLSPCVTDAECGAGLACRPFLEGEAIVGRCGFALGPAEGLQPCDANQDCRTGQCIDAAGAGFCWSGCADHADCGIDGICFDFNFDIGGGRTAPFRGCRPGCLSDLDCQPYGSDAICAIAVADRQLVGVCATRLGPLDPGAFCTTDAVCGMGVCVDNALGAGPATNGFCLGPCEGDADCSANTTCRAAVLNVGTTEEPEFASIPVCWGAACTRRADCPAGWACTVDLDPADFESVRLSCMPAFGTGGGGSPCTANADCATGLCNLAAGYCWAPCETELDCAPGSICGFAIINDTLVSGCVPEI